MRVGPNCDKNKTLIAKKKNETTKRRKATLRSIPSLAPESSPRLSAKTTKRRKPRLRSIPSLEPKTTK